LRLVPHRDADALMLYSAWMRCCVLPASWLAANDAARADDA
jgi:hypothetical protein